MADVQVQKKSKRKKLEKKHECPLCGKLFSSQDNLERHMITIHDGEKPHTCSLCGKGYITSKGLKYHMATHTGEKPHKCSVCDKGVSSAASLKTHMLLHTGEKPYTCPICNKSFRRKSYEHMMSHKGEKPHKCSVCGNAFLTAVRLRRHMLTHTGEKPHECPLCSRRFGQKGHLKDHMKTHSARHTLRRCTVCSQEFTAYGELSRHMVQHMVTLSRPHSTTGNKVTGTDLSGSEALLDQFLYACSYCDRQFDTETAAGMQDACNHLDSHEEKTLQPGPSIQDNTDKNTVKPTSKEHRTAHANQIIYACSFCDKQFDTTTSEGMIDACDHLDTHQENKVKPGPPTQQESEVEDEAGSEVVSCTAETGADVKCEPSPDPPEDDLHSRILTPTVRINLSILPPVHNKTITQPKYLGLTQPAKSDVVSISRPAYLVSTPSAKTNLVSVLRPARSKTVTEAARFMVPQPHVCSVCHRQFTQASYLHTHMFSHKEETYKDASVSVQHTRTPQEGQGYRCTYCGRDFVTESALEEHQVSHDERLQYACSVCSRQFDTMLGVWDHMHSHNDQLLQPPKAEEGDDKGLVGVVPSTAVSGVEDDTTRGTLSDNTQSNIHTVHVNQEWDTSVMVKTEKQEPEASLDMSMDVLREPHLCVFCGAVFESKLALNKHMADTVGSCKSTAVRTCVLCSKSFSSLICLKAHIMTHTGEQLYKCSQCKLAFVQRAERDRHMLSHKYT